MNEQLLAWVFRFLVLVWKMRKHQKAYFTEGRKQSDLIESKRLETEVDKALKQHLEFSNGEPVELVMVVQEDEPTQERLL